MPASSTLSLSSSVSSCTEHELVAAVRAGSDQAFEELYSRFRERISAYVRGMVRDHARAEDLSQEVFISALRRMRSTERPIAFKPWIYEIAKNACVDEFRRGRRLREVPLETGAEGDGGASVAAVGPDAAVEGRQRLEDLRGAFRGLSETHHRILVLRELEGRSYQEIADRMGISKPIVESTLFRARRRLGEEYEELASGRRCVQTQQLIAAGEERTWKSLRTRQRRQLARHLSHCQPCRRAARQARIDERFFGGRGLIAKVGALLPIPWLRLRRGRQADQPPRSGPGQQLYAVARLQSLATYAEQSTPALAAGRLAAAAAALVIGGGGIVGLAGTTGAHRDPVSLPVSLGAGFPGALHAPPGPTLQLRQPLALPARHRPSGGLIAKPAQSPRPAPTVARHNPIQNAGVLSSLGQRTALGTTVKRVTGKVLAGVNVPITPPRHAEGAGSAGGSLQVKVPDARRLPAAGFVQRVVGAHVPATKRAGASSSDEPTNKSAPVGPTTNA